MKLCANISMLFTELPVGERVRAAASAGFSSVEFQFPCENEIAVLREASERWKTPITLINVPRGRDDEVGLAALPGREADFRDAVAVCASQAERLGVAKVNVLAGRPPETADHTACRDCLAGNLKHAADIFAGIGVRVMVEPVNSTDVPGFFLTGLTPALEVLRRVDHPNLFLQFDLYHMAITEPDLVQAIGQAAGHIGHVQFADTPGRHEPGTGNIDFPAALHALSLAGYNDVLSAEYRPKGATADGLDWLPRFKELTQ